MTAELQPPPGVALLDRLMAQTEAQERAQAAQPDLTQQMMMAVTQMMATQMQMLKALTAIMARLEQREALPKKAPKDKQR